MKFKVWGSSLWITVLTLAVGSLALAQVTASISGRIEDSSGAGIADATITVASLETGVARTITADADGAYRVVSLPVGQYEVRAEKAGFKTETRKGINLAVGQEAVVNLRVEVGAVTEQVTVTGEASLVNTTTSSISGLVGEQAVKDLPLNGRSFDQLIALNTGAINFRGESNSATGGSARAPNANRFSVAGRRASENYFLLNGMELAGPNQDVSLPFGASGLMLGVEAVREFNVQTDAYGAEYGKRPGAQVTIVTQSGTNQLHGSLFEFLRNSALDARNFFDPHTIPPFERNQFGAALGGPIRKDTTFIFGNFEGFQYRLGESDVVFVPDVQARQGLLPVNGVLTPVAGFNPAMVPFANGYFAPPTGPELLSNGLPTGIDRDTINPIQTIREDYGTLRFDHYLSAKDSVNIGYTISDGTNTAPLANAIFANLTNLRYQVGSVQETHIFSPNVVNVFTAGITRVGFSGFPAPIAPSSLAAPPFTTGHNPGALTVGGAQGSSGSVTTGGGGAVDVVEGKTLFTFADQVQMIKGNHQISYGVWFQRERDNLPVNAFLLGTTTFSSLNNFLAGNATSFAVNPNPPSHEWRIWMGALFVQDNIKLRPNLSVRIGLRDEFTNGWNGIGAGAAAYYSFTGSVINTNPVYGGSVLQQNNAKHLLGPRAGLAWDVFGNGKTSVRAGFGMHYWVQDNISVSDSLPAPPPYTGQITYTAPPGQSTFPFLSLVPVNPATPVPPTCGIPIVQPCVTYASQGIDPNFKTPTIIEWNFGIEQQLMADTSLRVAYVGSHGYYELVNLDPDTIQPLTCANAAGCVSGGLNAAHGLVNQGVLYVPVGSRPNPDMNAATGYVRAEGISSYNALQVEVKRRLTHGLQLRGNFTWAKNMDDGTGTGSGQYSDGPGSVLNPYNPLMDYGLSNGQFKYQSSISGNYELPFGKGKPWLGGVTGVTGKVVGGWQLNAIATLVSGFPITVVNGSNIAGNGNNGTADRLSWNPAFTGSVINGTPTQWYNPNAFVIPLAGTFGNMARGALTGPGLANLDVSLFKSVALTERIKLQFRGEIFNILNRANFGVPNITDISGGAVNPTAGAITATTTTSRQIQFAMKLTF